MWGRCLNAGQTCIAADYVLCHHTVAEAFAAACVEVLAEFFGSDGAKTEENLSRIVAERHFDRLADMLKRVFVPVARKALFSSFSLQDRKARLLREDSTRATEASSFSRQLS